MKTLRVVVIAVLLVAACDGKDKVDRKVVDNALHAANACRDVECAQAQLDILHGIMGKSRHGLSKEDIDLLQQADHIVELKIKVIQEDAGGNKAPAAAHLARREVFKFMFTMCRLTYADPHPTPEVAASIANITKWADGVAGKLGITIPPRPATGADPRANSLTLITRVSQIAQDGIKAMKDYPPADQALLGVGLDLCALWTTYQPGDASSVQFAEMLGQLAPTAGLDGALVADVIAKVKAKAAIKDVNEAADHGFQAIGKTLE